LIGLYLYCFANFFRMEKNLALFDFDGTITSKDSLIEFIKFYHGTGKFLLGFLVLLPVLVLLKLHLIHNQKAKEIVMAYFFRSIPIQEFQAKCNLFASNVLPKIIRPGALEAIKNHRSNGDRVIIVTASFENWLKTWAKNLDAELLASQLELADGRITGKILGKNCYGQEKVNRLSGYIDLKQFTRIYAYGDSKGDREMLAIAHVPYYRKFN